jgi:Fe-S cluster assembly iron-binding protein IscA
LLTITEAAGEYIAEMLARSPDDLAVRLAVPGAQEHGEDESADEEAIAVLVLDRALVGLLTDRTLDLKETDEGLCLTLQ